MIKLTDAERTLVEKLNIFKKEKLLSLNGILDGVKLGKSCLTTEPTIDIDNCIFTLNELISILSNFKVGFTNKDDDTKFWIVLEDSSLPTFNFGGTPYSTNPITEKNFIVTLLLFKDIVDTKISIIEGFYEPLNYFCQNFRVELNSIIYPYICEFITT